MSRRVVVTGAAGFIGSNLSRALLDAGCEVLALDNLSAGTRENLPPGIEFIELDIAAATLAPLFARAVAVFHLAAKNSLPDCAADPVETARVNVLGSANVARAAVSAGVPHLIYADTSAEYEGVTDFPSRIDLVRPLSVYACSKRSGALMVEAIASLNALKVSFVRYFNVYGPAQDWRRIIPPVMSGFTLKLLSGERPVIYGTGKKRRDFIHVDDINAFHLRLLREAGLHGGTFNLGSGTDFSMREIFDLIQAEIGTNLEPLYLPELPGEAERTQADLTETLKTGWAPSVELEKGVRDFIKYTRERFAR